MWAKRNTSSSHVAANVRFWWRVQWITATLRSFYRQGCQSPRSIAGAN
jgi:hypothetical protein